MASHVVVVLDTTAPDLAVDTVQDSGEPTLLTLTLTADADATEVKLWGGIDITDPLNSDYAEAEQDATWIEFTSELQARAAVAGSPIYARVRDDVLNESEAVLAFGTVPPPTPQERPTRGGFPTRPTRRTVARRRVESGPSRIRVSSRTVVSTTGRRLRSRSHLRVRSRSRHVATMSRRGDIHVESATAVRSSRLARTGFELASETAIRRRPEGPRTEAALLDLDII